MVANAPLELASTFSNDRIMNMVWDAAPLDYQSRIPHATQGNIRDVINTLDSFRLDWNVFIDTLLNGLVLDIYRNNMFENPLAQFKVGRVIENGTWIREIAYNLLKARRYDLRATDVFDIEEPELMANFHRQNRKDRYELSISEDLLRQAMFANPQSGLANLISGMLQLPFKSDQVDEYIIMRRLFGEYEKRDGFYNVNVDDIATATDKRAVGLDTIQKIREYLLLFQFMSRDYNAARVPTNTTDPVLFATPQWVSNIDVNVLAAAFNMEKADFLGRLVVVDHFDFIDEDEPYKTQALLADPQWFVAADTRVLSTSLFNPKNLVTNYWLHRWGIYSCSRFVNAVLFSTRPDSRETINMVSPSAATIYGPFVPGSACQSPDGSWTGTDPITGALNVANGTGLILGGQVEFRSTLTPYTLNGGKGTANQSTEWTICPTGNPWSTNTAISAEGILHVATDEQMTPLQIAGHAVDNPFVVGTSSPLSVYDMTANPPAVIDTPSCVDDGNIEEDGDLEIGEA